jgi:hypothetical protein
VEKQADPIKKRYIINDDLEEDLPVNDIKPSVLKV